MQKLTESDLANGNSLNEIKRDKRINKRKWSSNETRKLFDLIKMHGFKWKIISQNLYLRSSKQCMQKYYNMMLVEKKGKWNNQEDKIVSKWVALNGPTQWSECAKLVQGRCGKQCRERWLNFLNPDVKRGKWDIQEQMQFAKNLFRIGLSWVAISEKIKSRSENLVKNFFYCSVRMIRLSPFYQILKIFFLNFGTNSESKIIKFLQIYKLKN